ncbi:hypothetical protein [Micromonospora sp. NBC_01796]|uniref:hypothetical protein n=1 Tax=Micromonospora sp. NBC_01796 TaxID=2975987 RepID=UPI002DDBD8CD|nr:hypothetical protein [Micromonospora sp. NBC_01796]WSA86898.1 hypothetical protein OIE47_04570 [Micromonospora sp. NBC_01796]
MSVELGRLTLRVVVPGPSDRGASVEVRPLVDGEDILARVFREGPGADPAALLRPYGPLTATVEAREVRLAEASCTEGCCGAIYVTVRLDGDQVVWADWRNPDEENVDLPEFRFDAAQYAEELDRATIDRDWEWPARTVARLVEELLRRQAERLTRQGCELDFVTALPSKPYEIGVFFLHPDRAALVEGRPWLQFRARFQVTAEDPSTQAERLAELLLAADPRVVTEVCGGSPEYADRRGHVWPSHRERD